MDDCNSPESRMFGKQLRVNALLAEPYITKELRNTRTCAQLCRTAMREQYLKRPPHFRYVSQYNAAIFDPSKNQMYQGTWSDLHSDLVRAITSDPRTYYDNQGHPTYLSMDIFTLRGEQGIHVALVHRDITFEELVALEEMDLTIMDSQYRWLTRDTNNLGQMLIFDSPLSDQY